MSAGPQRGAGSAALVLILASVASVVGLTSCTIRSCGHTLWSKSTVLFHFGPVDLTETEVREQATFSTSGVDQCFGVSATHIASMRSSAVSWCTHNPATPNHMDGTVCAFTDDNSRAPSRVYANNSSHYFGAANYQMYSHVGYTNGSANFDWGCTVVGGLAEHDVLHCAHGGS